MADETRTVEFKIKTTADNSGSDAASKKAEELKKKFDQLAVELNKVSKDGATVKTKAILPLSMALEQLKKEAEEAGVAVEGLDKASVALEKAGVNAAKTAEALEDLKKKTGDAQAKVGGMGDLFDKGGTKMERFRNGAGMLADALGTGLAIGTGIAKKAGVDFTETLSTMSEWAKKAAVAINTGITKSMEWLAGGLEKLARLIPGMGGVADALENIRSGLDGIAEADAGRAKAMEIAEAQQKNAIATAQKNIALLEIEQTEHGKTAKNIKALAAEKEHLAKLENKTAEEQRKERVAGAAEVRDLALAEKAAAISVFEAEVALRKKTLADVVKLNKMRHDLAVAERKTSKELQALDLQGEKAVVDFKIGEWERGEAALLAMEQKAAAQKAATNAKAKEMVSKFWSFQKQKIDGSLSHLKETDKNYLAEFTALMEEKIELEWEASDKGIEAEEAYYNASMDLTQKTADMQEAADRQRVATTVGGINAGLGAAAAAFPENKEIQVGQTVMATYESATNAYKSAAAIPYVGFILGPIAAAAAVLAGLKTVQQIESTPEPKGKISTPSFDDPVNDAMARRAGRQSAIDLVNHTSQGFAQQLASGQSQRMDGNTTGATVGGASGGSRGGTTINVIGSGPTQEVTRNMRRALLKYDQKIEVNVRGNRSKRVF